MVTLSFDGASIRLREDGRYLRGVQVAGRPPRCLLERHAQYFGALQGDARLVLPNEGEETTQGRQSAVARVYGRSPLLFDVLKKGEHIGPRQVFQGEGCNGLLSTLSDESQK